MRDFFTTENLLQIIKETIWLALTAILTYAVLYPIITKLYYLYTVVNAAFIIVALTYFRWNVTFKSIPFLRPAWIRFLLFTANFALFIYLMQKEQHLIGRLDDFYLESFGFPKVIMYENVKLELFAYLNLEIVLSATASLLMIATFQMRLIISYWQYYKHETSRMLED